MTPECPGFPALTRGIQEKRDIGLQLITGGRLPSGQILQEHEAGKATLKIPPEPERRGDISTAETRITVTSPLGKENVWHGEKPFTASRKPLSQAIPFPLASRRTGKPFPPAQRCSVLRSISNSSIRSCVSAGKRMN